MLVQTDCSSVAFHSLFGNFCTFDQELTEAIQRVGALRGTLRQFQEILGAEVTAALHEAYFLSPEGEERGITEEWMTARAAQVSSGRYLGGLQITSSNACNFSCSYCFADASDRRSARRQAGVGLRNISFATARLAIDQVLTTARRHGRQQIGVKFLGREPLINFGVMDQLLQHYSGSDVAWSLTTNGSLLTPAIARRLAETGTRVVVSIDGLPEVNDALRRVKSGRRGQSAYELAMRGLRTLFAAGVSTSVSSVISTKTDFAAMPDFFEVLRDVGCREIELTLAMQNESLRPQSHSRSESALAEQLIELYHAGCRSGLQIYGDWIDPYYAVLTNRKLRTDPEIVRARGVKCQASEHQISVEPNGDLFPCRAMSLHYGTLDRWQDVLESEAYRSVVMRTYFGVSYCRGCPLEGHCQGTCLGSLEESSGDIYSPQVEYCDVYRSVVQSLLSKWSSQS